MRHYEALNVIFFMYINDLRQCLIILNEALLESVYFITYKAIMYPT